MISLYSSPNFVVLLVAIAIVFAVSAIIMNLFIVFRRKDKDLFNSEDDYRRSESTIQTIKPSINEPNSISFLKYIPSKLI